MIDRSRDTPFSFGPGPGQDEDPEGDDDAGSGGGRWKMVLLVLVVLAGLAGAGAYVWLYQPHLARSALQGTPLEPPPTVTRAYKWRDADGAWQLTDRPPPEGVAFETLDVSGAQNILPLPPGLQDR